MCHAEIIQCPPASSPVPVAESTSPLQRLTLYLALALPCAYTASCGETLFPTLQVFKARSAAVATWALSPSHSEASKPASFWSDIFPNPDGEQKGPLLQHSCCAPMDLLLLNLILHCLHYVHLECEFGICGNPAEKLYLIPLVSNSSSALQNDIHMTVSKERGKPLTSTPLCCPASNQNHY